MKSIAIIIKKELRRFFTDRRLLISVFMPGIMIYLLYSLIGNFLFSTPQSQEYKIAVQNPSATFQTVLDGYMQSEEVKDTYSLTVIESDGQAEEKKKELENKELDLLVIFSADFDEKLALYMQGVKPEQLPVMQVYYNALEQSSQSIYTIVTTLYDAMESSLANVFEVAGGNVATESDGFAYMLSTILPMLIMVFLFQGSMMMTPESIAGEKERGTFATMLVTPVSRSAIAVGKIIALSLVASLSGLSSFLGVIFSLPKMAGMSMSGLNIAYGFGDYLLLFANIIVLEMLFVALVSVISAYAHSIKEATAYSTVLMIVVMLVGMVSMVGTLPSALWVYFIPVFNAVVVINQIVTFSVSALGVALTIVANLVCVALLVLLLAKMFNNENIIFGK